MKIDHMRINQFANKYHNYEYLHPFLCILSKTGHILWLKRQIIQYLDIISLAIIYIDETYIMPYHMRQ